MGHFTRSLRHGPFETRVGTTHAHEVGKGNRRNNAPSRSPRRSGHSILAIAATRLRAFDRNLICGEHYGQRPKISAASTGRTHGSTDQLCITVKKTLANREPSTHGYKRRFRPVSKHDRSTPESRPSSGNVRFLGVEIRSTSDSRRRWARSARTGYDPKATFGSRSGHFKPDIQTNRSSTYC